MSVLRIMFVLRCQTFRLPRELAIIAKSLPARSVFFRRVVCRIVGVMGAFGQVLSAMVLSDIHHMLNQQRAAMTALAVQAADVPLRV